MLPEWPPEGPLATQQQSDVHICNQVPPIYSNTLHSWTPTNIMILFAKKSAYILSFRISFITISSVSIGNGNANEPQNTVVEEVVVERKNKDDEESSKMFSCLKERPLWFLFLVMTINGLFSLACSALIIKIEKPAQDKRYSIDGD